MYFFFSFLYLIIFLFYSSVKNVGVGIAKNYKILEQRKFFKYLSIIKTNEFNSVFWKEFDKSSLIFKLCFLFFIFISDKKNLENKNIIFNIFNILSKYKIYLFLSFFFRKQLVLLFNNQITFKQKYLIFSFYKNEVSSQLYFIILYFFFYRTTYFFMFPLKNNNFKKKLLEILIVLFQFYYEKNVKLNSILMHKKNIHLTNKNKKHISKNNFNFKNKNIIITTPNTNYSTIELKKEQNEFIRYPSKLLFKDLNYVNLKKFNIFFLRKNKIFNKGRYSRNRQNFRTGVYWCIWVNIVAVLGLYFFFLQIYL